MSRKTSLPHQFVFDVLTQDIIKSVKVEAVLTHLLVREVITRRDFDRYIKQPKNGMKILIGYLRDKTYDTFLEFVECIFLAQGDDPSKVQSVPVVESMILALQDLDKRQQTTYTEQLVAVKEKYLKQFEAGIVAEEQSTEAKLKSEEARISDTADVQAKSLCKFN